MSDRRGFLSLLTGAVALPKFLIFDPAKLKQDGPRVGLDALTAAVLNELTVQTAMCTALLTNVDIVHVSSWAAAHRYSLTCRIPREEEIAWREKWAPTIATELGRTISQRGAHYLGAYPPIQKDQVRIENAHGGLLAAIEHDALLGEQVLKFSMIVL